MENLSFCPFVAPPRQPSSYPVTKTLLNLITVGDSAYEMEAAEQASSRFEKRFLKTVRLRDKPRGEQLLKEVRLVYSRLSELFCCPKNMSIKLQPKR